MGQDGVGAKILTLYPFWQRQVHIGMTSPDLCLPKCPKLEEPAFEKTHEKIKFLLTEKKKKKKELIFEKG